MGKYRIMLVNGRGYSLQFTVEGEAEEIEKMIKVLQESPELVLARGDKMV